MSEAGLTDSTIRLHSWPEINLFQNGRGGVKLIKPLVPGLIFWLTPSGKGEWLDRRLLEMGLDLGVTWAEREVGKFTFDW